MKQALMIIPMLVMLTLAYADTGLAGDSLSLSVSCTIPAIPGVNSPLIEEEKISETEVDTATKPMSKPQEEPLPESPQMIQQDSQEEETVDDGQRSVVIVRTIYSR